MLMLLLVIMLWLAGIVVAFLRKGKVVGDIMDYAKNNRARIWFLLKIVLGSGIGCAAGLFTGYMITLFIKVIILLAFGYVAPAESPAGILLLVILLAFPFPLSFYMTKLVIFFSR